MALIKNQIKGKTRHLQWIRQYSSSNVCVKATFYTGFLRKCFCRFANKRKSSWPKKLQRIITYWSWNVIQRFCWFFVYTNMRKSLHEDPYLFMVCVDFNLSKVQFIVPRRRRRSVRPKWIRNKKTHPLFVDLSVDKILKATWWFFVEYPLY